MANKELQKKRTLIYFIDAAQKIMEEEGISSVTLRKVAEYAGYNSATLYNYFDDLDQLIMYASLKYLNLYHSSIIKELELCKTERECLTQMWKTFCRISFQHPEPFERIFFNKHSICLNEICRQYYELFPEEEITPPESMTPILSSFVLSDRNRIVLKKLCEEEHLDLQQLDIMNDLMIYAYSNLLHECIENHGQPNVDFYTQKMFGFINFILQNK